jgi:hypothetical protein
VSNRLYPGVIQNGGSLVVVEYGFFDYIKGSFWKCECSCGNLTFVSVRDFNSLRVKRCPYCVIKERKSIGRRLTVQRVSLKKPWRSGEFVKNWRRMFFHLKEESIFLFEIYCDGRDDARTCASALYTVLLEKDPVSEIVYFFNSPANKERVIDARKRLKEGIGVYDKIVMNSLPWQKKKFKKYA